MTAPKPTKERLRAPNQGGTGARDLELHTTTRSLRSLCDELQMFRDYRAPNHDVWGLTENAHRVDWLLKEILIKYGVTP